ncbi:hypothetical protein LOK49_LG04G00699 [Camellia lanceoleosa]|uniref:Uncharacterized protein n=1 Tax=Camellia lanceoleosa TaxID=1840588 RepID=A0ACC0I3U4_9ERIC|nr:hypothetical protein LOK49_LG04G00699 [Camellia lanceoleosa]
MPTELTSWQYGITSPIPIPIEPPMLGHRYVSDPDSPPPPREYIDQMLGVVASLEGMVLRRGTDVHHGLPDASRICFDTRWATRAFSERSRC